MNLPTTRLRAKPLSRATLPVLLACAVLLVTTLVGAGSATAASACNSPVSGRDSSSIFRKGIGAFACTNVNSVSSKVDFYSRHGSSVPYELRTSTGWVAQGNIGAWRNWTTRTVWVSVAECQSMYVRSWVRWKYPRATSYTYRNTIRTWSPC